MPADPRLRLIVDRRALAVGGMLGAEALQLILDLAFHAHPDTAGRLVVETSLRRLGRRTGISKDTVARHLAQLAGAQLITKMPSSNGNRFAPTRYLLTLDHAGIARIARHAEAPTLRIERHG